jgi:hypothetical protein
LAASKKNMTSGFAGNLPPLALPMTCKAAPRLRRFSILRRQARPHIPASEAEAKAKAGTLGHLMFAEKDGQGRMWQRFLQWYDGEFVENDPASPLKFIASRRPSRAARGLRVLVKFYLNHWKWIIGFLIAVLGLATQHR